MIKCFRGSVVVEKDNDEIGRRLVHYWLTCGKREHSDLLGCFICGTSCYEIHPEKNSN